MRTVYKYFILFTFSIAAACGGGGGGGGNGGGGDTTKPATPTGLTSSAASANRIDLSWTAASDDVGVAGYKIYRNGVYLKSESGVSTSDTGLSAGTQYCYKVSAYDAANNESAQSVQVCAATPFPVWFKTYGTSEGVQGYGKSVKQTSDGGYIIVGISETDLKGSYVYILKTDAAGKTLWDGILGSYSGAEVRSEFGRSVQQTADGGYIVLGEYSLGSNRQMWLIKTDANGGVEWDRLYGYDDRLEEASEVQQTSDGGYILVGTTTYFNPLTGRRAGSNVFLVKTDRLGNTQWYKQKGYDDSDETGASVQQTSDGGYILTGITYQFDNSGDLWLVKVGADGSTVWHHHYGIANTFDEGTSVRQTTDGGYIFAGSTGPSSNRDICLLKTDSAGNRQWARAFGGPASDWNAVVQQTTDGGYVIAGSTYSYGAGQSDGYLIKTDAAGNTLWTNTFGGSGQDYFHSVQQTRDGGYIMTGSTESYGDGSSAVYLVKTDANGSSLP